MGQFIDITAKKAANLKEVEFPTTHFEGNEDEGKDIHGQNVQKKNNNKKKGKTEKILPLLDVP